MRDLEVHPYPVHPVNPAQIEALLAQFRDAPADTPARYVLADRLIARIPDLLAAIADAERQDEPTGRHARRAYGDTAGGVA